MHCTTISSLGYKNIITIHIADNTANITNNKYFIATSYYATHSFSDKRIIALTCTSSHNISAIISTSTNFIPPSLSIAKISRYTADIMGSSNSIFTINSRINICIYSHTYNTTDIATSVIQIFLLCSIFKFLSTRRSITANIPSIYYIFYFAILCRHTCNTTNISSIDLHSSNIIT